MPFSLVSLNSIFYLPSILSQSFILFSSSASSLLFFAQLSASEHRQKMPQGEEWPKHKAHPSSSSLPFSL